MSVVNFSEFAGEPDWETMDRCRLTAYLNDVRGRINQLDEQEPADMNSEEYDVWGVRHEELEDLADEIRDKLDAWEEDSGD